VFVVLAERVVRHRMTTPVTTPARSRSAWNAQVASA
jgi:hypothetical protein